MLASQIPTKFPIPFGNSAAAGTIRAVPQASQTAIDIGQASLVDGFPIATGTPLASGGKPPSMQDFNGLFNQITAWNRWQNAGGMVPFDQTFCTAIGGYPAGALLLSTVTVGRLWISTVDNNTTNPDAGATTAWLAIMLASDVIVPATAAVTLYVDSTSGNDTSGTGSNASPFRTNAKALLYAASRYSFGGYGLSVQNLTPGTYDLPGAITGVPNVSIVGNPSAPASYLWQGSGTGQAQVTVKGSNVTLSGGTLYNTNGAINTIGAVSGGVLSLGNVILGGAGVMSATHVLAGGGGSVSITAPISVTQSAASILDAEGGNITSFSIITVPSGGVFSTAVVVASGAGGQVAFGTGASWSGTTTGPRFSVALNAVINTFARGVNWIPGSTAGTQASGGQYA